MNTKVVSDEKAALDPSSRFMRHLVTVIAVAMSLYHMYVAWFGPPEAIIFRGTHLMFALALVFLLFPSFQGTRKTWRAYDMLLLALGLGGVLHIFMDYEGFTYRIIYIDDLTPADLFWGVTMIIITLEATRRIIGWALPLTAILFVGYAALFTEITFQVLIEQLYLSTEGIFGSTLGVSAAYVMLFVIFGAFMEKSGTGRLFMDFSLALTGNSAGGPGKVAIISSSMFGTVSGSAVANVMVTGPITIPLMKRTGFKASFAGAVESVSSTGGQIMPPVMGAVAFVMAEFLAVPYLQITIWAIVPAFLFYLSVFFAVHFEAKRYQLAGVPKDQLPKLWKVMLVRGQLFIPMFVILIGLILGYSAPLCALVAALVCLPVALLRKSTREDINWYTPIAALEEGARGALSVAMACACAGLVIGSITITGLGIVFTQVVIEMASNYVLLALVVTAIAGIVLGMGMPTTPAYIVMVALLVPALIKMGIVAPAAHLFALYFAILSAITPPVALSVFAAAGIAQANMWQTGLAAVRAAAPAYIVPFMFVYEPALLFILEDGQSWYHAAIPIATATIGVIALAGGLFGWFVGRSSMLQRILLCVGAFSLINPGSMSDLIGFGILIAVSFWQLIEKRKSAALAST
ncbi:TRAP transporter permease [Orrella sp. 11846]|uniref:TRAP transporter permease n=1 Tax=Orrella sp. 11846 TaxID=3409913 RepID=UPI003B5B904B